MNKHKILLRKNSDWKEEIQVLETCHPNRFTEFITSTPRDSIIIGRYSVLPYYTAIDHELRETKASRLINTVEQHEYIANMEWTDVLHTPATYKEHGWLTVPDAPHGWVCKGRTNSRKFRWKTHMRAESRGDLKVVIERLHDDTFISEQGVVIREFCPLEEVDEPGLNGLPITNEWRFFYLYGKLLAYGFYWPYSEVVPEMEQTGLDFADQQAAILSQHVDFFCLDIAKTINGDWIVIEANDGQMSGLSTIDPGVFYKSLFSIMDSQCLS